MSKPKKHSAQPMHTLVLQTHLAITELLRHPLYRHQAKPRSLTLMEAMWLKPTETFQSLMKAMHKANIEQKVVR